VIAQFQMNDAPFTRRHRFQNLAAAILDDLLGHAAGQLPQLPFTPGTISLDVDQEWNPVSHLFADNQAGDVLQGIQGFRLAANQDAEILALHLNHHHGAIFFVLGWSPVGAHLGLDFHFIQELCHHLAGGFG